MNSPEFSRHIDNIKLSTIGIGMSLLALTGCAEKVTDYQNASDTVTTQVAVNPPSSEFAPETPIVDADVDKFMSEIIVPKLPEVFEYFYNNPGQADSAERNSIEGDQNNYRYIRVEGDKSFVLSETTNNNGEILSFSYQEIIPGSHLEDAEREDNITDSNPNGDIYLNYYDIFIKDNGNYGIEAVIDDSQVSTEVILPLDWGERTFPGGRENNPQKALEFTVSMLKDLLDRLPELAGN